MSKCLIVLLKISVNKVFLSGNLICGLRNLKSSITSGLFIQDNGNPQEMVTCNKCNWNFLLSEFERDRTTNESIGPLKDYWDDKEVKEEREEIESLLWLIESPYKWEFKASFPVKIKR